jgi:hypothetical protein
VDLITLDRKAVATAEDQLCLHRDGGQWDSNTAQRQPLSDTKSLLLPREAELPFLGERAELPAHWLSTDSVDLKQWLSLASGEVPGDERQEQESQQKTAHFWRMGR